MWKAQNVDKKIMWIHQIWKSDFKLQVLFLFQCSPDMKKIIRKIKCSHTDEEGFYSSASNIPKPLNYIQTSAVIFNDKLSTYFSHIENCLN